MSYLLNVNVLIAMGYKKHEFHQRVTRWAKGKILHSFSFPLTPYFVEHSVRHS